MRQQLRLILIILTLIVITACSSTAQETGVLEGHVTIGPLVPVLRAGEPEPTPAPEVYASRQIVIYGRAGRPEITRANINPDGNYQVTLPVGTYVVDINHTGIDHGVDLPQTV